MTRASKTSAADAADQLPSGQIAVVSGQIKMVLQNHTLKASQTTDSARRLLPEVKVAKKSLYERMSVGIGRAKSRLTKPFGALRSAKAEGKREQDTLEMTYKNVEEARQFMRSYSKRSGFSPFPAESLLVDIDGTFRKFQTVGGTPVRRHHRPSVGSFYQFKIETSKPDAQRDQKRPG